MSPPLTLRVGLTLLLLLMASLRVCTHNVRGLLRPGRLPALMKQWHSMEAYVICLQETHLSVVNVARAEIRLHALAAQLNTGWRAWWAHDHRPVLMSLAARPGAAEVGPGLRRVRLHFAKHEDLEDEFSKWLEGEQQRMPPAPDHQAVLRWWPGLKARVAIKARQLNQRVADRLRQAPAAVAAAEQEVEAALAEVEQGTEGATARLLEARRAWRAAARPFAAKAEGAARRSWLHAGERPCPLLTRLLSPPADTRLIPALRRPSGALAEAPIAKAQVVADFWAGVASAEPAGGPAAGERAAAMAQVLGALAAVGPKVSDEAAATLGAPVVSEQELEQALRRSPPGKAPGPDGIPGDLYRRFRSEFSPMLRAVFDAIGATGQTPRGFLDGATTVLYKKGDRTEPGNYRPITLLGSDYRLLARLLATRLGGALAPVIDREQTGFLPGRSIGENILTLQLLPGLLSHQRRSGVVVFLDIAKAYDTLQRPFLFGCMETMGLGSGFMRWTKTLLGDTRAAAVVNGYASRRVQSTAGVRQGCPLSPGLYLLASQALISWLRAQGHGIHVRPGGQGRRLPGVFYADDSACFLESLARLPALRADLRVYSGASGQELSVPKCEVLLVGHDPPAAPPGGQVEGMAVVSEAATLGLTFSNDPAGGGADWEARLERVLDRHGKVARLGALSTFGRAFAASAYGVSTMLYHAEFGGVPGDAVLQRLSSKTARLVDGGRAPADTRPLPTGVPHALLAGGPLEGGFGLLPWRQHILARHAVWGVRLITAAALPPEEQPPWVVVALELLGSACQPVTPVALFSYDRRDGTVLRTVRLPAGPLHRLAAGLVALPPLCTSGPVALGQWCGEAPLWDNPLLPGIAAAAWWGLHKVPVLSTVGGLVWVLREIDNCPSLETYTARVYSPHLARAGAPYRDRHHARAVVSGLVDALPAAWRAHAEAGLDADGVFGGAGPLGRSYALQKVVAGLGWAKDGSGAAAATSGNFVSFKGLTVKQATDLQMLPVREARLARVVNCVQEVRFGRQAAGQAVDGAVVSPLVAEVFRMQAVVWRGIKWENDRKEVWWRLVVGGIPNNVRMNQPLVPCFCGRMGQHGRADRLHHFWECPVALAVRDAVESQLPDESIPLTREHFWLLAVPAGVHPAIWPVVSLAALNAMDKGRRQLFRARALAAQGDPAALTPLAVGRRVVAHFWDLLDDFASCVKSGAVGKVTDGALLQMPDDHPFFRNPPGRGFHVVRREIDLELSYFQ